MSQRIPVKDLYPNPYAPAERLAYDPVETLRLQESVVQNGQEVPLVVRKRPQGGYEVGDGWQRVLAFKELGRSAMGAAYAEADCELRVLSDADMAAIIIESTIHKDLSPIGTAQVFKHMVDDLGLSQAEVARRRSISASEVANTLRLLELPQAIQDMIVSHKISGTHGRTLLQLQDLPDDQLELAKWAARDKMPVAELDERIKGLLGREVKHRTQTEAPSALSKTAAPVEAVTDPHAVTEIENSIAEGELILKSGKSVTGRNMSADELASVQQAVDKSKAKIGQSPVAAAAPAVKTPEEVLGKRTVDTLKSIEQSQVIPAAPTAETLPPEAAPVPKSKFKRKLVIEEKADFIQLSVMGAFPVFEKVTGDLEDALVSLPAFLARAEAQWTKEGK